MLKKKLHYWNKALIHLKQKDKILAKIILHHKSDYLLISNDKYTSLLRAIIGQQISVKAAHSIWLKFSKKYNKINPKKIADEKNYNLKKLGLSRQKVLYVKNISHYFLENKKRIKNWHQLSDEEVIQDLITIKGIGIWTAEMFLMFSLGRPNIFPINDLGFLKAISINYNKSLPLNKKFLDKLKKKWDPWCSVATWYLWRSIDPIPVNY